MRGPEAKQQNHLHAECRMRPSEGQWEVLKQNNKSLTCWMQNQTIRGSERCPAAKKQDHLQTECRTRPSEGQRWVLQERNKITCILSAEQGHQRVREGSCTKGTRSLTFWVQNKAIRGSERGPATMEQDHLHAECRQGHQRVREGSCSKGPRSLTSWVQNMAIGGQRGVLHQRNKITYMLSEEQGHQRVREGSCTKGPRSLTFWVQNKAIKGSERGLAAKEQDHLQAECSTRPP